MCICNSQREVSDASYFRRRPCFYVPFSIFDRKVPEGGGRGHRTGVESKRENDTKSAIVSTTVVWAVCIGAVISSTRIGTLFLTFFTLA